MSFSPHDDDESINRVLAGLGKARIEDGFAQRITHGVERRVSSASARRPMWIWALGFATAVAAASVIFVMAGSRQPGTHPGPSQALVTKSAKAAFVTPAPQEEHGVLPKQGKPVHPQALPLSAAGPRSATQLDPAEEASFPAPPEPLTEQERLLRRIAHTGDRVELAALNPEISDRLMAMDRSQVDAFFYQPPRVDDKGNMIDGQGKLLNGSEKGELK